MKRFGALLVVLLIIGMPAAAEEVKVRKHLFYRLTLHDVLTSDADEILAVLSALHERMIPIIGNPELVDFEGSLMEIVIHGRQDPEHRPGIVTLVGDPKEISGKFVYTGKVDLPNISLYDGKHLSTSGHPKDKCFFFKLLVHEVSVVYLGLLAKTEGYYFYTGLPNWAIQGIEEYIGVYYSTPYWVEDGRQCYYDRLKRNPSSLDLEFGLILSDDYSDGFLFFDFIRETYGPEKVFRLFQGKVPSFGTRLKNTLGDDFPSFHRKMGQWKAGKIGSQQGAEGDAVNRAP